MGLITYYLFPVDLQCSLTVLSQKHGNNKAVKVSAYKCLSGSYLKCSISISGFCSILFLN